MVDDEYALDMWSYFYENMRKNEKYIHYYNKGLRSKNILTDIYSYNSKYMYMLILLINDKTYIPTKESVGEMLKIEHGIHEDKLKLILETPKFRKCIDLFSYCVYLADHCFFKVSVYLASDYMSEEKFSKYRHKYINSVSVNLIFDPSSEYTQDELYRELSTMLNHHSIANVDHIINKISEQYSLDKFSLGYVPGFRGSMHLQNVMRIIKCKYMIKNIIKYSFKLEDMREIPNYITIDKVIYKSEIISYKFYDVFVIKYTITNRMNSKLNNKIKDEIYDNLIKIFVEVKLIRIWQEDDIIYVSSSEP